MSDDSWINISSHVFCMLHQHAGLIVSPPSVLYCGSCRVLQGEYRRLKWKHEEAASVPMLTEHGEGGPGSPTAEGQQDEELLAEARVLRQHKTRLETRMQILEDHNKQLESQLRRLRELLLQVHYSRDCYYFVSVKESHWQWGWGVTERVEQWCKN